LCFIYLFLLVPVAPFLLNPIMPKEGLDRREYRSAKFGSWEKSQELDTQVAAAGASVGRLRTNSQMKAQSRVLLLSLRCAGLGTSLLSWDDSTRCAAPSLFFKSFDDAFRSL
jgi:hypothetical protein